VTRDWLIASPVDEAPHMRPEAYRSIRIPGVGWGRRPV
jgi:hypothetical protein